MRTLKYFLCSAALALPLASLGDTVVFEDTFESYANQAALEAAYVNSGAGTVPLQTTVGGGAGGSNQFVRLTAAGTTYLRKVFPGGDIAATDANPINVIVYMKAANWGNTRAAAGVRASNFGVPIAHIGSHNGTAGNTTPPDSNPGDKFMYRLVTMPGAPTASSGWIAVLAAPGRTAAVWHKLQLEIGDTAATPIVNDVEYTANAWVLTGSTTFGAGQIGYGSPANLDVDVDNFKISQGVINATVSDWDLY